EAGQGIVCRAVKENTHLVAARMEHGSGNEAAHQLKDGHIGIIEGVAVTRVRAEDPDGFTVVVQGHDDHRADADFSAGFLVDARIVLGEPILSVGLAGMRERMRQLGGAVTVVSGPEGTCVRACLPRKGARTAITLA
ncbi:MAG TPA: hypothetical protein VK466_02100, partial [Terriglobales bacterium]|nr:hypothetical protein [Terriglobales bacterium]